MTILKAVWSFLCAAIALMLGWCTEFMVWLRKPGSVLKVCCAFLAVCLGVACLASYQQARKVTVVTKQAAQCAVDAQAAAEAAQLRRAELEQNVADKDAALATIAGKLQAEAGKLRQLQERNATLKAQTDAAKAAADKSAKAYKLEYDQRPPECTAALQAMAAACPTLGGY